MVELDIAIFSAGGDTSLEWAPKFASCVDRRHVHYKTPAMGSY